MTKTNILEALLFVILYVSVKFGVNIIHSMYYINNVIHFKFWIYYNINVGVDELMHTAPVRSKAPTGLAPRRPM